MILGERVEKIIIMALQTTYITPLGNLGLIAGLTNSGKLVVNKL